MKRFACSISVLLVSIALCAQSVKDSLLMKERSIDRAITLHRGQFRIEGGYGFSAITKRFDDEGETIKLSDEGISYVRHAWALDFRYGILENLTLNIASGYKRQSQRIQEVIITDANFGITRVFEIQKKNGLEDLLVALSARAPFTPKTLDLVVTGGIYIPTGKDEASEPEHTVTDDGAGFRDITYRYNSTWGSGTLVTTFGGLLKYRSPYYAFTAAMMYNFPLGESEEVNWQHQLVNNDFEYEGERYAYQLPGLINFSVEIERQLAPWFDLSVLFYGKKSSGGWDEIDGERLSRPEVSMFSFSPGYEILVTPKIWLRQRFSFPIMGKNEEAPFSISTSLVYNFFPFN